jgi:hypothetical protein
MEQDIRVKAVEAARKGTLYGFIANHYWEFSNEELKDIILEVYFAATEGNPSGKEAYGEEVASELEGRWDLN